MYQKALVPLDGSALAECALGHVQNLVKEGAVGDVTLLNVVKMDVAWAELYGKNFDLNGLRAALFSSAEKYLAKIGSRLDSEGLNVKTAMIESNQPAQAITHYARENGIGLIVIATHGYTGMKKLMMGSVALNVLHDSNVPVLLIRPEACRE
jgi:nucleotide-binding universal stress UspA family protein